MVISASRISLLSYLIAKVHEIFKYMFTSQINSERMIVLGVHMSGVIGCDAKPLPMPSSLANKYFQSSQGKEAIASCIKQAKRNPLQTHISNQIRVQVSAAIGRAIKSGEIDSILGLKAFLEAIKTETEFVTVIGRNPQEDEVILII